MSDPEVLMVFTTQRLENLRLAMGHVGTALALQGAEVALNPSSLTPELRDRYMHAGQALADTVGLGLQILSDLANTAGIDINVPGAESLETPAQPAVLPPAGAASAPSGRPPADLPQPPSGEQSERPAKAISVLFAGFVNPELITSPDLEPNEAPVEIVIVSNRELLINGSSVILDQKEIFILNAALLTRGEARSRKELYSGMGFDWPSSSDEGRAQQFSLAMRNLLSKVGPTVMQKINQKAQTRYLLHRQVRIVADRRRPEDIPPRPDLEALKKN